MVKSGLVLACVALAQWVSAQQAPQMEALPIDPNVRYGVLDNGLTYYVRHNETPKNRAEFHIAQVPQDEFVKIDPTELPQAVMQTLAKDYEGASVKEAYVKETEETTLYKIIIVTQDGQEAETLLNEKGEIVKE